MDEQKRELDERDEMLRMIARLAKEKERARQQASKASDYDWLRGLSEPSPQVQKAPFVLDTSADDLWRLDEIGRTPHSQPPPTTPTARRPDQKRNASRAPQTHPQKKGRVKRVFAFSLVLVVAAAVLLFAAVNSAAGKVRQLEIDPADASVIATPQGRSLVTNILLLGADGSGSSGLRSDTMLLLSIDRVHRKLKLTSFLRDSWVQLPNGNHAKLNAALSTGGVSTALRAISTNFDVRLDHYALVNFDSFKEVVDALGGVAVPITEKEIAFLCNTTRLGRQLGRDEMRRQMEQNGKVKLTGEQALIFCRIRKLDDDFSRTSRQRIFLESTVQACKANPSKAFAALQNVLSALQTDMTQSAITSLALSAPLFLGYEIVQHTVPATGTWDYGWRNGASVIVLDTDENAARLRQFIYE